MSAPIRLTQLTWERVKLELAKPLVTSNGTIVHRDILLICAKVRLGPQTFTGFGESAPLPGWTAETITKNIRVLEALPKQIEFASLSAFDKTFPSLSDHPTLRFGVELALLDALARSRELSIAAFLAEQYAGTPKALPLAIRVQSTLGAASTSTTCQSVLDAFKQGYRYCKLKVGCTSPAHDLDRVAQVVDVCPEMKIRLDANGAWTMTEALNFLKQAAANLPTNAIDLIEQPVPPPIFDKFLTQAQSFSIPVAPDESCAQTGNARRLIESGGIRAIVLKPSILGGLLPTAELIRLADARDIRVIISSLIESSVARSGIAQLAAAFPQIPGPHGLAVGHWFSHDLYPQPDRIKRGQLRLKNGPGLGFKPAFASSFGQQKRAGLTP